MDKRRILRKNGWNQKMISNRELWEGQKTIHHEDVISLGKSRFVHKCQEYIMHLQPKIVRMHNIKVWLNFVSNFAIFQLRRENLELSKVAIL